MQNFTSEIVVKLDADVDEHMTAENDEKKIENNSTKNKKTCDNENELLFIKQFVFINVTLIELNMNSLFVRFILLNWRKII